MNSPDYDFKICSKCDPAETENANFFIKYEARSTSTEFLELKLRHWVQLDIKGSGGRLDITGEDFESLCKEAMKDIMALFVDSETVSDNLVDQTLHRHAIIKPSWFGYCHHPLTPSVDGFLRFVRGTNNKVMYHFPGNINVTSDSVNRLFRHYPKFLGHAFRRLITANKHEDYVKGLRLCQSALINDYELGVFGHAHRSKYLGRPCNDFKNFDQAVEALISCKPLPRTVKKSIVWRTKKSRVVPDDVEHWKFDDFEYFMAQLHVAAKKHNLDTPELQKTWLRDGKFFPFSQDSFVPRWTHWDCFEYFAQKLSTMRNHCDRHFKNQANRPSCSVQELMIVVAHLHMAKVAKDLKKGREPRMCGRDQAGLLLYPTLAWLLSASIGHDKHGMQMLIGLTGYDPQNGTDCIFDPDKCNILWETWACNLIKFCYHSDYYPEIFAQLRKFRETPLSNSPVPFASPEEVFSNIRDLTNELDTEIDGGIIDPDSTYFAQDDLPLPPGEDEEDDDSSVESDDPDFIFRCPCGKSESVGVPSYLIIGCRGCGEFQHKKCMGIAQETVPHNHECELCDEERYFGFEWPADKEPEFRFRCLCGDSEGVDVPSRLLVRCEMCGEWQHRACFNILVDDINPDHACEKCDPVLLETLRISAAAGSTPGSGDALGRPNRRNMGRLNQTCFISAATQLLLAIPQASSIVAGENTCRPITGRDPKIMPMEFQEFEKLGRLFLSLKNVYNQLSASGIQLDRSYTRNLLHSSTTLEDSVKDGPRWQDVPDNASEYFMYLTERMVCVSDISSYNTIEDGRTAQYTFEKEMESRNDRAYLDDLEKDTKAAIAAYQASGNHSSLAEALTVHMVRESQCVDCDTILRKFQHNTSLVLKLPENLSDEETLDIPDLMKSFYEQSLGSQGQCQRCHVSMQDIEVDDPAKKWRRFGVRILNAPQFLIFEIDRLRLISGLGKNRVRADTMLDLKDLQPEATLPSPGNRGFALDGETRYERIGMLAYLGDFRHWIACVKEERGKSGRWVLYDDTNAFPEYKSPEEITDPEFCECLIVYRKIDELGDPEEPLVGGPNTSPQSEQAGFLPDLLGDDTVLFEDLDIGMEKIDHPQVEDDTADVLGTKSPETAQQQLERVSKKLAETEKALESERERRISAEKKLGFQADFYDTASNFQRAAGIVVDDKRATWVRKVEIAGKEVATVKKLLQSLGLGDSSLSTMSADTIINTLRKDQISTQLDEMPAEDVRTIIRAAFRRLPSDDSLVSTFDTIYKDLIAPAVTGSGDPLRAWDVANERMIRPMLSSLARAQLKKAQPQSPIASASQSQKSKIPVPKGGTQLLRSSTSTLTGTKSGEHSGTGDTTESATPQTAIRQSKSVRFGSSDPAVSPIISDLDSSPPTTRERVGESSRKRSAARDRFAGEKLGDDSKRLREGEDTSGSDFTQDSPLLDRAKRVQEAGRQEGGIEKGSTEQPKLGPPKWPLRRTGSGASFLQPTQSSRGKDIRLNPSTTTLSSIPNDRTVVPYPLGRNKSKPDFGHRLTDLFRSPKKSSSGAKAGGMWRGKSSKEDTEDDEMTGE